MTAPINVLALSRYTAMVMPEATSLDQVIAADGCHLCGPFWCHMHSLAAIHERKLLLPRDLFLVILALPSGMEPKLRFDLSYKNQLLMF